MVLSPISISGAARGEQHWTERRANPAYRCITSSPGMLEATRRRRLLAARLFLAQSFTLPSHSSTSPFSGPWLVSPLALAMTSPHEAHVARCLSPSALVGALNAARKVPKDNQQAVGEAGSAFRNTFLDICDSPDIYDVARSFITDPDYWDKEERHFRKLWGLLLDTYEAEHQQRAKLQDISCPSASELREIWSRHTQQLLSSRCKAGFCRSKIMRLIECFQ